MSKISNDVRKAIYRRDGFMCAVCGDNRRLQIHHIQKRSQGGGDDQFNLITLCDKCHALAHGINLVDAVLTQEDVEQAMVEYMSEYYIERGILWPSGKMLDPWGNDPDMMEKAIELGINSSWEDIKKIFGF